MNHLTLTVEGMSCGHCAEAITKTVGSLAGVTRVEVNLAAKTVAVEYDQAMPEAICAAIDDQGFEVVGRGE